MANRIRTRSGAAAAALSAVALAGVLALLSGPAAASGHRAAAHAAPAGCTAGARTLSAPGDVLYPEVGNGGYRSVHTATHTVYDARANRFLPGNHVDLTDRATQCLSSLSVDFERSEPGHPAGGPDMQVQSVAIDGVPASFAFAQPTYPGDPKGADDPDPRAHEASQHDPVGGPDHDPLPPACSPELLTDNAKPNSRNGTQCPADKLVITPATPIPAGHAFTITVAYTGRPGLHHAGDGSEEGWFRTRGGDSMVTEPVGSEDWMPLNDHPSAKPTYDFSITSQRGKTAIANGRRTGVTDNPPDADFPAGSQTTTWHAPMGIPSYLVETIVGDYTAQRRTVDGRPFYVFQDRHISARRRARNARVMAMLPAITRFEERFNGPFPFASDGVVAGIPGTSDDTEEMESMIVFTGGTVDTRTLYHENFHQWWGDNVTEGTFDMAFFKEGMATLSEQLYLARGDALRAGGLDTAAGRRAFQRRLVHRFDSLYRSGPGFWKLAPSNTAPSTYLDDDAVYERPSGAYIALRQILGPRRFDATLRSIQRRYGGSSIVESQLRAAFTAGLPSHGAACTAQMRRFFHQWFDTAYRGGKPSITGPGLPGRPFYTRGCERS